MPISYTPMANSTYADFDSYMSGAPLPTGAAPVNFTMNVALVFDRVTDPTSLLNADWATRQQELAALNASNTLWSTYGANPANFTAAISALAALPTPIPARSRARAGSPSTRLPGRNSSARPC